ncbi:MAG: M23 family metallopeptidase, partial [Myxococcota bacterium]
TGDLLNPIQTRYQAALRPERRQYSHSVWGLESLRKVGDPVRMGWGGQQLRRGVLATGMAAGGLALVLAVSGCGATGPPSGSSPARIHTVKGGETLWRISRKYETSVAAIARANGLKDPTKLAIGQKLRIPAGHRRHRVAAAPSNRWMTRDARGRSPGVDFRWPVRGKLASRYGMRDNAHHDGIDISGKRGTRILAAEAGRVIHSDNSLAGYGNMIILKHTGVYSTVYAHNRRNLVKVGQFVEKGQAIAELGDTGRTTAPHLHFEIRRDGRPANPLDYLR